MYRILLSFMIAAVLSGCIKLQMPDDMVSDAIEAIRDSGDDEPADDGATTFSHSIVGAAGDAEADLKKKCLSELESRTSELLGLDRPSYTVVSESVKVTGDKAIASCTVRMS